MGVANAEMTHNWSGWPGAYCLDCWKSDPVEECIASHSTYPCIACGMEINDLENLDFHRLNCGTATCAEHNIDPCKAASA